MKIALYTSIITIIVVLGARHCLAQGDTKGVYHVLVPNARTEAMGHAGIASVDSATVNQLNPAGLAFLRNRTITFSRSSWMPQYRQADLFYIQGFAGGYFESLRGTLSIAGTYLSLGEFNRRDEFNNDLGISKLYQQSLTISYSLSVVKDFCLGLSLRYIRVASLASPQQSNPAEGIASTISADVSALWRSDELELPVVGSVENRLSVGIVLSNAGPKITYVQGTGPEPLPTNLGIGLGYDIIRDQFNNATIAVDVNRVLLPGYEISSRAGIEYWYGEPRLFAIRIGYLAKDPESFQDYVTVGFGLRYTIFGFDLSTQRSAGDGLEFGEGYHLTALIAW